MRRVQPRSLCAICVRKIAAGSYNLQCLPTDLIEKIYLRRELNVAFEIYFRPTGNYLPLVCIGSISWRHHIFRIDLHESREILTKIKENPRHTVKLIKKYCHMSVKYAQFRAKMKRIVIKMVKIAKFIEEINSYIGKIEYWSTVTAETKQKVYDKFPQLIAENTRDNNYFSNAQMACQLNLNQ